MILSQSSAETAQANPRCSVSYTHLDVYKRQDEYTERSLKNAIFGVQEPNILNPDGMPLYTIAKGVSHGVLTGGNLSLLAASLGTPYEIETKDKILFIEDIGETPVSYTHLDVYKRQLLSFPTAWKETASRPPA